MRRSVLLVLLPLAAACARGPQPERPRGDTVARLDSATAAKLCANPEQARAGLAPCELRDQAPSPALVRPAPPR